MDIDKVGLDVHLVGTVWQNQENGETYVLPLSWDNEIVIDANMQVLYFTEVETQNLLNRAWLLEARRSQGEHGKKVTTTIGRMNSQIEPKLIWKVFRRDKFCCVYCGDTQGPLTYDHFIPQSKGGPTNIVNGRSACRPCNKMKGDMEPSEWLNCKELKKRKAWISKLMVKYNEHESKMDVE